jgi:putative isomerase
MNPASSSFFRVFLILLFFAGAIHDARAQSGAAAPSFPAATSRRVAVQTVPAPPSTNYHAVQQHLAQGWNTWDTNSVTTHVLLPEGLAIAIGLKHNSTLNSDAFLGEVLIGRLQPGAEQVTPGPHAWDGSYTELRVAWRGHSWRIQSAHDAGDLVLLATLLPSTPISALPPTLVVSVDFLWNRPGTALRHADFIETRGVSGSVPVYCTCDPPSTEAQSNDYVDVPLAAPYFSVDFTAPVGISTGRRRTLAGIQAIIERQRQAYEQSVTSAGAAAPIRDAIETTLGWDTIYEPNQRRVISPVSRNWNLNWGGYVLFDWDTFFAATLASIGDRDLAYANAMEILREETPGGFVPNCARPGGWKTFDHSEPAVGAITVLGLYQQFHDRWFLADTFEPLLSWNRWWDNHRQTQGYLVWGDDAKTNPTNLDDGFRETRQGAVYESGLDNSPMYDGAVYDPKSHLLEIADVGLMSLYIADCDALAQIADVLGKPAEARELRDRSTRYRASLATLWSEQDGIFFNKDLVTGEFSRRLSPTNFYPLLARAATPAQAQAMIQKHLLNPKEFWGRWVIPAIARDDPAFADQDYWRGRIWGPMNYLVYLGLRNYDAPQTRRDFAQKSYDLFLKEWKENGHVHENYNAITGSGDDVTSSDRFYHWGALLGYVEYMEQTQAPAASQTVR